MTSVRGGADSDAAPSELPPAHRPPLHRPRATFWQWRPALLVRRGNRVEGPGFGGMAVRLRTAFWGTSADNVVRVGRNFRTRGLAIWVAGQGNRVEIGDDVRFTGTIEVRGFGLTVRIGDRCDVKRSEVSALFADVEIGADCLVAADVRLRSGDVHTIVDRSSGLPINMPRPIRIGTHVWLGAKVTLLKGARVPDGCVVGFNAVVTRPFEEDGCVLAGSPARVVRRDIAWSR